jgi:hypothetical protein
VSQTKVGPDFTFYNDDLFFKFENFYLKSAKIQIMQFLKLHKPLYAKGTFTQNLVKNTP